MSILFKQQIGDNAYDNKIGEVAHIYEDEIILVEILLPAISDNGDQYQISYFKIFTCHTYKNKAMPIF